MGLVSGIRNIQAKIEASSGGDVWRLGLKDGEEATFHVATELDDDSPNYDPERGMAVLAVLHRAPHNYRKQATCTMDSEGRCWACEQVVFDKRWRSKQRFFFGLLTERDGEMRSMYYDTSVFKSSVFDMLRDRFLDSGSVSDVRWKLKRKGAGQMDTTYTLMPVKFDDKPDWSDYTPVDFEGIVPTIPYAEQAAFYGEPVIEESSEAQDSVSWL